MLFFISTVGDRYAVTQVKGILKIFNFTSPKFFQSGEISGVGRVTANKLLIKDGLSK